MSAYLPQSQNGSILITSRSKGIALKLVEENNVIVVEPMAESHALALFEKKLGALGDRSDITELAGALERMPLAIVQSAAYIHQRAPRCAVRKYLEDFRKSDHKKTSLLNYEGGQLRRDWEAKNSIIITWQISFEYESQSQSQLDQDMGRKNQEDSGEISVSDDGSEDDGFEHDVQVLRNYSFISCDTDRTFEMHALVQLAMRKWLEANEQLEPWEQQYIKSLSAAIPNGEYENSAICQALFPHATEAIASISILP
ncbi:MAG: hypothetical protein Q9203_001929 [Teloschistes exilis]